MKNLIEYRIGVKQSDNLIPILLIIVMKFLSELTGKKFEE